MNPIDLTPYGTRQAIDYLLGMTQQQRQTMIVKGIKRAIWPQYSLIRHQIGVQGLSDAERALIAAGLAATFNDDGQAAQDRAEEVFEALTKAGHEALGPDLFSKDNNNAIVPLPRFAIFLHEALKTT